MGRDQGDNLRVGPKVLIVTTTARSLSRFKGDLIRLLVERGHQVVALAPDHDENSRRDLKELGAIPGEIVLHRSSVSPLRLVFEVLALRRIIARHRPHFVISYFTRAAAVGLVAAWLARVPVRAVSIEGLGFAFTPTRRVNWNRRLMKPLVWLGLRLAVALSTRAYFFNRDDAAAIIGDRKPCAGVRLLAGVGVDLKHYAQYPLPHGPPKFLLVARLLFEKGIEEFFEAARLASERHPQAQFWVVGGLDAAPGAISEEQVRSWERGSPARWFGPTDDVRPWLKASSVFVLPSYREGSSRSIQEAMACGRPVITTTAPGCRNAVDEGRTGLLVAVGDSAALAGAMLRFLDNPQLARTLGSKARAQAEARYDASAIASDVLADLWGRA